MMGTVMRLFSFIYYVRSMYVRRTLIMEYDTYQRNGEGLHHNSRVQSHKGCLGSRRHMRTKTERNPDRSLNDDIARFLII